MVAFPKRSAQAQVPLIRNGSHVAILEILLQPKVVYRAYPQALIRQRSELDLH